MKLSCESYQDFIHLYIDHALSPESTKLLEAHLTECKECQDYLEAIKEDLPAPVIPSNSESEKTLIKQLRRNLLWTQSAFLLCGILICTLFTLSENMFQNVLLLPLIGLLGFLFTKKLLPIPLLTTAILWIGSWFKEGLNLDALLGLLLFAIIYFALTLIGSGIGYVLIHSKKDFRSQTPIRKVGTLSIYLVCGIVTVIIFLAYNSTNGNPITALYAKSQITHYLETTYVGADISLHEPSYSFKSGSYHATAYMHGYDDIRSFDIQYRHGDVWDNYFHLYLEDMATSKRLETEAKLEIEQLLNNANIPFDQVEVTLRVPKDTYNQVSFDKNVINEPMGISVLRYTKSKDSYETFSKWCESIRRILTTNGYNLESILLDSDPYFMVSRLSLSIQEDALQTPIVSAEKLNGFVDYGALNGIDENTPKDDYTKNNFYQDALLTSAITKTLEAEGFTDIYPSVQVSDHTVSIHIEWFGTRISPDTFADTCIALRNLILDNQTLFNGLLIDSIYFNYCWGTSYESYGITLYEDTLKTTTSDNILQDLLTDSKKPFY